MARNRRHELGVGVLVLVAAGLLAWMALQVGAMQGLGRFVHATARLDDAAGLTEGAEVKVAGVAIGRVDSLRVEDGKAVLALAIRQDAGIHGDARVAVRARSVLGEKYVEIVGGSAAAPLLEEGDTLAVIAPPLEIDQLVNRLGPILDAVDPAAVSRSVAALDDALSSDPDRVERMVGDLERLLHNTAVASDDLPGIVDDTRATLSQVRAAASEARPVIARADAVVEELEAASGDLAASRAQLDGLIGDARRAVQGSQGIIDRLDANGDRIEGILDNLEEIDKWELRRLLREEGILVRLHKHQVVEEDAPAEAGRAAEDAPDGAGQP